ncbi:bifunctional glycosyltransferase/CDP-glycerol:glycerophosphate glycerophosphotransferase [Romboutsia sp.]|uniref:bifunctional glycosyltransferase/CDP-glycerol:glycerophosphate glycerophosphotransferase n=1 Tax=Romboutsia sp. TaxID=1965302 RepID=UPI003F40F46A
MVTIPKISIIIPVYNVEEYISYTLDSVLNQTLKEIEIILIDDGSTDNSKTIIEEYSKKYNNIKIIYQQNSGPSKARNRGIELAKGEFITFADSDDILPPKSLEVRYNTAIETNSDIVIGGTYKFNSKKKWMLEQHFLGDGEKNVRQNGSVLWTVSPWNKIYKSELIKQIRFPENLKYAEDQPFVLEAYLKADKMYSINEVVYYYRMRENNNESLTDKRHSDSANVIRQILEVWKMCCDIIDKYVENEFIANKIKSNYMERLAAADIWIPVKASIISKNKELQRDALKYSIELVENINEKVMNEQKKLIWIMTKGITDRYLFIDKSNRKLVLQLIKTVFNKLDANSIYKFRSEQGYYVSCMKRAIKTNSTLHIYEFLIRRRIKRIKNKLKLSNIKKSIDKRVTKLCTEGVFKISKILPVKKNLIILATNKGTELEGNLKFIDDELIRYKDLDVKVYLDKKNISKKELVKMYYNFARAKFILLDNYYRQIYGYRFKEKTEIIQLWHACGAFKKFGFSAIGQADSNSRSFEENAHRNYTKVLTSSKNINKHYAEAFNIDEEKILNIGIPRTDGILNEEYREFIKLNLENMYPQIKGKKIITYAPTFRGNPRQRKNFKCELDYETILKELGDEYVIILKLHPAVTEKFEILNDEYKDRVLNLTKYKDINDILSITDILITDYSSVIFEYALLDRPIILFAYDLDSYVDERNFYYEYNELVPGPIVKTNKEIIDCIQSNKFDFNKINEFKNKFFDFKDSNGTKRIVEFMRKEIKNS